MFISKKTIIIGLAAVGAIAAATWYFARPEVLSVDTAVAKSQPLEAVIEANGRTRVRERYLVVAPVTGRVERIAKEEGALVRPGDVVARIFPLPLDSETRLQAGARVDAAASNAIAAAGQARVAHAALDQRKREHARAMRLVAAGALPPRAGEEAQLALVDAEEQARGADERLVAADADLRQARSVLDARAPGAAIAVVVRAPAAGRVLRVAERSERIVTAGSPLMEIGDPRSIEVVADLLSSDVGDVAIGDPVRFPDLRSSDDGETAMTPGGTVTAIEPSGYTKVSALGVEEQRVNVIVALGTLPVGLGDGHRVSVAIIVWSSKSTLTVPRSALVAGDARGAWRAFVVRGGVVERRDVRVGHLGGADAEVLGGIAAGEAVVVYPSDRVRDGSRVKGG